MTEADTTRSTASDAAPQLAANPWVERHAAAIAAASMNELITCARLFAAAIHAAVGEFSDDDRSALGRADDHLCGIIASRRPVNADEFAAKAGFLIGRVQDESLSDAADAAALEGIRSDAIALANFANPTFGGQA